MLEICDLMHCRKPLILVLQELLIKGEEEYTKDIFGEYVSIYDFKSSIKDGATLPLTYVNKGEKLNLDNPNIDNEILKK